jgi:PAS domain S-box-containing protein
MDTTPLLHRSHDLFATGGTDGRLRWVSEAWEAVLGWTSEELTTRPFLSFVHPDDQLSTLAAYGPLVHGGSAVTLFRNRWRTRDGRWRHLEWNAAVLPDGTIYGVARDLTHLGETEARGPSDAAAEAALGMLGAGYWTADGAGEHVEVSPRARQLLGLPEEAPTSASQLFRRLDLISRARIRRELRELPRRGGELDVEASRIDTQAPVRVQVRTLADPVGRPIQLVGTVHDLSARRDERSELQAELSRTNEARRRQSMRIDTTAHELRNSVAAIHSAASAFGPQTPLAGAIQAAAGDLLRLVDELTGQADPHPASVLVDPAHMVDDILTMLEPSAHGVALRRHVLPDLPELVLVDARRLRQALTNLTLNALKFTREGEVRIELRAEPGPPGPWLRFDVVDTGSGIPEELQTRVLEPWVGTSTGHAGGGLGLSIVRDLMRDMGGTISLTSSPAGTRVTLHVPLRTPTSTTELTPATTACRVLVVDDHPIGARVAAGMLRALGCQVTVASCVGEAEPMLDVARWDLILVDHHLPDGSGTHVTQHLREVERAHGLERTPVIGTSAGTDDLALWRDADIDDEAPKPLSPKKIEELLRTHAPRWRPQAP